MTRPASKRSVTSIEDGAWAIQKDGLAFATAICGVEPARQEQRHFIVQQLHPIPHSWNGAKDRPDKVRVTKMRTWRTVNVSEIAR